MISVGRADLVRAKPLREKKPKTTVKSQQELGCSDKSTDSIEPKDTVHSIIKHSCSPEKTSHVKVPQPSGSKDLSLNSNIKSNETSEESESQSTGDKGNNEATETSEPKQSKDLMSSIKSFFKLQILDRCFFNLNFHLPEALCLNTQFGVTR